MIKRNKDDEMIEQEESIDEQKYSEQEESKEEIEEGNELEESSEHEEVAIGEQEIEMTIPESMIRENTLSMTEKEVAKLVSSHSNEVTAIMADVSIQLAALKEQGKKVSEVAKLLPVDLVNGVSLLELKSQLLLSYNELLLVYALLKTEGVDLQDHPLFTHLVKTRSLIEKLDPLELKMKHHIDTILNPQQTQTDSNPLNFRPNLDDLDSSSEEGEGEVEDKNDQKPTAYVPPKIAAVPYTERDAQHDDHVKEKLKDQIASNSFIREMKKSLSDRPDVINMKSTGNLALDYEMKEIQKFEDNNFSRVILSRDQKKKRKQAQLSRTRGEQIGDLNEFDAFSKIVNKSQKLKQSQFDEDEFGGRVKRVRVDGGDGRSDKKKRRGGKRR